jgi:signal transduction histidine kinase
MQDTIVKFKDFSSYLILPARTDQAEGYLHEMKRLEWIFIAVRWLWVPMVFVMAWLHHPEQATTMRILGVVLAVCNAAACLFNVTIKTPRSQHALGISMLTIDTFLAWGVILLFVRDFYTAAYAGFVYIVLEAAIRFGLIGSLAMIVVFALGLYGAYEYRLAVFGVRFSNSGYAFWTALMSIVAISVGMIIHEGRRQRWQSEKYLKESTLLSERHRIARDLHDTVLKTLQGLSLEARALQNRTTTTTPSVKDTAQYIEEVCSRTSQEIREVIFELRTEGEGTSIGSQISEMLNKWSKTSGISGEFTLKGHDVMLPTEPTRQIQNVISEALTNVKRHASASHARIIATISPRQLNVEISDDGHGIDRSTELLYTYVAEGKLGIAGIKERVELLGGRFSLNSNQNGTQIIFEIPISNYISMSEQSTNDPGNNSYSR